MRVVFGGSFAGECAPAAISSIVRPVATLVVARSRNPAAREGLNAEESFSLIKQPFFAFAVAVHANKIPDRR